MRKSGEETAEQKRLTDLYWAIPFDLHQVRDRHFEALTAYPIFAQVRDLIAYRQMVKDAEIVAKPVDAQAEKVGNDPPVDCRGDGAPEGRLCARARHEPPLRNAGQRQRPWVHGHKGAVFLRHFFYIGRASARSARSARLSGS